MPNIRGQQVLPDGFEVDTTDFGKRKVTFLELGGNDVRLTAFVNDVQVRQETLNNPSLTQIGAWISLWAFGAAPLSADGKTVQMAGLFFSFHIVSRNPLVLKIVAGNAAPPADWWQ